MTPLEKATGAIPGYQTSGKKFDNTPIDHREVTVYIGTVPEPGADQPPSCKLSLALLLASKTFSVLFEGESPVAGPDQPPLEMYLGWTGFPRSSHRSSGFESEVIDSLLTLDVIYRGLADHGIGPEILPPMYPPVFDRADAARPPPFALPPRVLTDLLRHVADDSGRISSMKLVRAVVQACAPAMGLAMGIECLAQAMNLVEIALNADELAAFYAESAATVPGIDLETPTMVNGAPATVMEPAKFEELYLPRKTEALDCRWWYST